MSVKSKVLPSVVRDQIVARITSGELRPGARLPAEPTLAASYGVSRATLREALRSLEEDGFVTRTPGAGTFVTHRPRLTNNLDVNFGVSDLIRAKGLQPGTENLKIFEAPASCSEGERLSLAAGAKVTGIEIPAGANASTAYPIATLEDAPNAAGAAAFVDYVLSADGAAVLTQAGFAGP